MKWPKGIALLLAAAAWVASACAQPNALQEGVKLIREGQFDRALIELEQAHRIAPRNATIENLLGIAETKLGHIDKANIHYGDAIRLDPTQAAPHRNLGFNLLSTENFPRAEPELHEASRLDPTDRFAHFYLLQLALATGQDAAALEQAVGAGQLVDNDPEAGAGLIEAEIRLGHVDEASREIERLEEADQLPPMREYAIALLLVQRTQYKAAARCFQRISDLDPSWEDRYNLALALLYAGRSAQASTLLTALHNERPENADILMFLGAAFEMQRKIPEALEAYRAALLADPTNPDRTLDYTRLLMDMDRYDDTIQVVQTSMAQTSAAAPLQLRLGAVEMIKGNYAAARDAFHAALANDDQLDAAYVGLAQSYAREANDADALRILEGARDTLPGRYLLEYYFGLLASRMGREQEAIVALQKAAQLEPNSPDPIFELGKIYASQQNWPLARQTLEHVVVLNSQLVPAHYQLSRIYAHLGLSSKAELEAKETHLLVDTQRDEALRKQRERAASFQPPSQDAPLPRP